jgi:hypothetical protein
VNNSVDDGGFVVVLESYHRAKNMMRRTT